MLPVPYPAIGLEGRFLLQAMPTTTVYGQRNETGLLLSSNADQVIYQSEVSLFDFQDGGNKQTGYTHQNTQQTSQK